MSKMDEVIKYSKELEQLPYDMMGEKCITKAQSVVEKAQKLGLSWKTITCFVEGSILEEDSSGSHIYAVVDGRKIDVTTDPDTKRICKDDVSEMSHKTVADQNFSKKHTWSDVIWEIAMKMRGENSNYLNKDWIKDDDLHILGTSMDDKSIMFIYKSDIEDKKQQIEEAASKFGVSCRFKEISDQLYKVFFRQTEKDRSGLPSRTFSGWKNTRNARKKGWI
jgi:hypothetical protein